MLGRFTFLLLIVVVAVGVALSSLLAIAKEEEEYEDDEESPAHRQEPAQSLFVAKTATRGVEDVGDDSEVSYE